MNAPASDVEYGRVRNDWSREEIAALFALPFSELIYRAQSIHRQNFDPRDVQISTLLSIKTGGCPEDCGYCSQSTFHETGLKASKLMDVAAKCPVHKTLTSEISIRLQAAETSS